jgi:hypothetical protein
MPLPRPPGCKPGEYNKHGKGCTSCDHGYFCPDGKDRFECVDWETTSRRGCSSEDDCFVASCDVCGGDTNSTTVYYTTAK